MNNDLARNRYEYKGYTYITRHVGRMASPGEIAFLSEMDMHLDWWNGYVVIPEGHELHKRDYMEIDIDCHGGLTFAGYPPVEMTEGNKEWWLGFDCNHYNDNPIDNDEDFVRRECRGIIDQLIKMEVDK